MGQLEKGINPDLVTLLTKAEPAANEVPTIAMLPGSAVHMIAKKIKKVISPYSRNKHRLRCLHCDYVATYDIGMIVFNHDGWSKAVENNRNSDFDIQGNFMNHMQFTAYIRCVACNGAGAWEFTSSLFVFNLMRQISRALKKPERNFMVNTSWGWN